MTRILRGRLFLALSVALVSSVVSVALAQPATPPPVGTHPSPAPAPGAATEPLPAAPPAAPAGPSVPPEPSEPVLAVPPAASAPGEPASPPEWPPTADPAPTPAPAPPPRSRRYVQLRPALHPITVERPRRRHGDAAAPLSLGVGASLLWPSDDGYRVAGIGDRQAHFDLFANYDTFHPSANWVISTGLSFRSLMGADEESVELGVHSLQADVTARYRGWDWFVPHVRLAAGAAFVRVKLEDAAIGAFYEGKDRTFIGNVGAGFTLRTKTRFFETRRGRLAPLSFGLLVEAGMTLAPVADPELRVESDIAEGIERRQAALGKLDLSGPYLRLAFVTRF